MFPHWAWHSLPCPGLQHAPPPPALPDATIMAGRAATQTQRHSHERCYSSRTPYRVTTWLLHRPHPGTTTTREHKVVNVAKYDGGDGNKVDKSPTSGQLGQIDVKLISTPKIGQIKTICFRLLLLHFPNAEVEKKDTQKVTAAYLFQQELGERNLTHLV